MAIESIIEWAADKPGWQQDALRRIALFPELSNEEVSVILTNLKRGEGLPTDRTSELQPLRTNHLQSDAREASLSLLCSISNVKHTNHLAPDQTLSFALDGITLIYGENGSGKSGYCRILKKICRTITRDPILPDVFNKNLNLPAEAHIRYQFKDSEDIEEFTWRDEENELSDVAHISVFDSSNTRLYVDRRNRIDYLPYEIELLKRFGDLLTTLKGKLKEDIEEVDRRLQVNLTAGYSPDTEVFNLVNRLTPMTPLAELPTTDELNRASEWTNQFVQKIEKLQETLSGDPQILAQSCRRVQAVISSVTNDLTKIRNALSQDNASELESLVQDAHSSATTASFAATELSKDESLKHLDSQEWESMFRYAREYSKLVYPNMSPPALHEGDLCVLCQQPLQKEAVERLRRFEIYIAGEAKRDAEKAQAKRDEKAKIIENTHIRPIEDIQSMLGGYADMSEEKRTTVAAVKQYLQTAHQRRKELLDAVQSRDFSNIIELDHSVINQLSADRRALEKEANSYDSMATDDGERAIQQNELLALQDRKRMSENLNAILTRRDDLERRARLKKCLDAVGTNAVSRKVSILRQELVTEDLQRRIRVETDELDLGYIPLKINDTSERGESGFEVKLDAQLKAASCDVLSEGEQHALGLACFLADINGQPVKHGIILDDPVSSLDHVRVKQVATRLVKEAAAGRQVIIFTHDLLFFSEMMSKAASHSPLSVPVLSHIVRRTEGEGFGVIEKSSVPWNAKPVSQRKELLDAKIKDLEARAGEDDVTYRALIVDIYTDLRESWERLVEEILLNKVIERYQSNVKTQSLSGVVVEDEDYRTIYWAMKRVSERSGHDMATAKNKPLPVIKTLKEEVKELDDFRLALKKRSKKTTNDRKKLESPPEATTASE